jgi:hypothetical protein
MTMPKATMDEYDQAVSWQNNIGLSEQILPVKSESRSKAVK